MKEAFVTYIHYLIHPFKSHDALIEKDRSFLPFDLSLYETLGFSWLFILLSSFFRLIVIGFLISIFINVMDPTSDYLEQFYSGDKYTSFYFLILSTMLDVVFFPLVSLFMIQFWSVVIKFFAQLSGEFENLTEKSDSILSVALSSNALLVIPVIGAPASKLANTVQMYAGLRKQFSFSPLASILILLTPYFLIMGFVCLALALFILQQL